MNIQDDAMLDRFRGPGLCELCGVASEAREGHHEPPCGQGNRLDIAICLVAVSKTGTWRCHCHAKRHNGEITSGAVLAAIAHREKATVPDLQEAVWILRRLDKVPTDLSLRNELAGASPQVKQLVLRSLAERSQ